MVMEGAHQLASASTMSVVTGVAILVSSGVEWCCSFSGKDVGCARFPFTVGDLVSKETVCFVGGKVKQ